MTEISRPAPRGGVAAGTIAGFVAALVGAGLYALFIEITEWEMPLATIIIGLLVGGATALVRPRSRALPAIAALEAVLGGALGTLAGYVIITYKLFDGMGKSITYGKAISLINDHLGNVIGIRTILYWAVGAVVAFGFVGARVRAAHKPAHAAEPAPPADPPGSLFQPTRHQGHTKP